MLPRVERHLPIWGLTGLLLVACGDEAPPIEPVAWDPRPPSLLVTEAHHPIIQERIQREPYSSIYQRIVERAAAEYEEPDPINWDHEIIGRNNTTAQANAFLAWLEGDAAAAAKARDFLLRMPTDFESNTTWDVNIRMPHVLMTYCYAYDLLRAMGGLSKEEAEQAERIVTEVTGKFFGKYLDNPVFRQIALGVSQNNHPIRTASAIGLVAIAFPDHPDAAEWANWAVSELAYLMGPDGRYIQPDGGVSEGPFYYGFAYGPAVALFIAMKNAVDPARTFTRDCRNRQDTDPWAPHGCVEGEAFTFDNPLDGTLLASTADWSVALRMPIGWRPPLSDGNFIGFNGGALLTAFGGGGHLGWDLTTTPEWASRLGWGMDLYAHHLAYWDDAVESAEPTWRNRFMPEAGHVVLRSGWDEQARWLLLVADHGAARKTLHNHVDGTSFSLAAYGEYLLLDPGYYKPDPLDNAKTAHSRSHNVILIDGQGAPDKGLLVDFGDADSFIENTVDGEVIAYAEAHQSYQETDIERSLVFIDQRYYVVADRLETRATAPREHRFRLGGWAGYDVGGVFEVRDCSGAACGARWEREKAGVDVHLASTAPGLAVLEPPYVPLTAPHVEAFDEERNVVDHGVADGTVTALAPGYLAVLAPYAVGGAGDDAPMDVTPVDAGVDASAWRVVTSLGTTVVWLREPTALATLVVDGVTLETDAELSVLALDGRMGLVARGTELRLDGAVVLQTTEPVATFEP